jgi:TolB-like protein
MNEDEKSALHFPFEQNSPISAESIRQQLLRITEHPSFRATEAQKSFLQFVVDKVLAGESDQIKGYTIATQVFGRREDFDQATDPVVSIHANKLRRAMEHYYLVEGKNDPIRIDMPKGTYVPVFHPQCDFESDPMTQGVEFVDTALENPWPTVLVRPFDNLTGDPEMDFLAIGLSTELAMEITRYQDIRVLMFDANSPARRYSDSGARFVIEGNVRKDPAGIKVAVHLIDARTGTRNWGDMHRSDLEAAQMFGFQEQVARVVTAKIAGESGIIAKTLSIESKNLPPSNLQTYQAILRYYDFNAHFSPESFLSAFEALKLATAKEPECGVAWSMLGRLYAINHSLEIFDLETPLEEAAVFAEKGVQLEPANQRVRIMSAFVKLLRGDIAAALAETDRSLALNPYSLILLENIGYLMTLCGDWERGPELIRKAIQLNPYYNVVVHYSLWVDWIRQAEYEKAHRETLNFRMPVLFWDPLMKAASFGLLDRIEEGRRAVDDLLRLKPDFAAGGRRLIQYYIKFDDIVNRTIAGLRRVGLRIE